MPARSPITTHVLDMQHGRPAAGLSVLLEHRHDDGWQVLARSATGDDGRIETLLPAGSRAEPGLYRLTFDTGTWFAKQGARSFYPLVTVVFEIQRPDEHHHVPLLLAAHGYTTYRGS